MIRHVFAAVALLAASPAAAAPADPAAALAFAHAWMDQEAIISFSSDALRLKMERCVKAGTMTQEQLDAVQPGLTLYLTTFLGGLEHVQQKVADKAALIMSTADLRQLATTFSTPLFRQIRKQSLTGMAANLVPRVPGCGDKAQPIAVSEFGATAIKRMTPAQIKLLAAFAMSPAGQHMRVALPQLTPVMMDALREEVANAVKAVGGSQEMQDKVRQMPSPITVGAPPPPSAPSPVPAQPAPAP